MRSPTTPSRSAGVLAALAAALVAAFVVAPRTLAAGRSEGFVDERHLIDAVREAFVGYWLSGERVFSPDLRVILGYWLRYHVAKAVIAALLLIVLAALGVLVWKAFLRAGGLGAGSRAALASAGVVVTMFALVSLAAVMANVQGAIAPFASTMPMLVDGPTDGALGDTLAQVRQRLASAGQGDQTSPALDVMTDDFARYHVAMAVIASMVAVALIGLSVALWTRFSRARSDRRTRRVLGSFGVLSGLLSLLVIVLAVANATTAANAAPALLAHFDGGW